MTRRAAPSAAPLTAHLGHTGTSFGPPPASTDLRRRAAVVGTVETWIHRSLSQRSGALGHVGNAWGKRVAPAQLPWGRRGLHRDRRSFPPARIPRGWAERHAARTLPLMMRVRSCT